MDLYNAGLTSIIAYPFVRATLEGLQRTLAKLVVKKEPMTVEMLEAIVQDTDKSSHLADLRLATACLLGFSGFLQFDELMHLRPCDIMIEMDVMTLKIACSKTDQLRLGDSVVVSRTGTRTCPVAMLERYLSRIATAPGDKKFLFRPIQSTKKGKFLRKDKLQLLVGVPGYLIDFSRDMVDGAQKMPRMATLRIIWEPC